VKRLIVNADDLGMSVEINRAIEYAHRRKVLNSCSLLVDGAALTHAIGVARRCSGLGIGLHLSLTTTLVSPPARVPRLAVALREVTLLLRDFENGRVDASVVALRVAALDGTVPQNEIETEFAAQIARFIEVLGRRPTHLDTHQHVHVRRSIYFAIVALAQHYRLPVRQVSEAMKNDLRMRGIGTTDRFVEVPSDVESIEAARAFLKSEHLDERLTELLVHPGFRPRRAATTTDFDRCRPIHLRLLLAAAATGIIGVPPSAYDVAVGDDD